MSTCYEEIKLLYTHERSIGLSAVKGTVYTPPEIAKQMIYYLLKSFTMNTFEQISSLEQINDSDQINDLHQNNAFNSESVNFDVIFLSKYLKNEPLEPSESKKLLDILLPLKIMDLSCGSGNLLLAYIDFLTYLIQNSALNDSDQQRCIETLFAQKIYGMDIEEQAILTTQTLFKAYLKQYHLEHLNLNLYIGNSLLDSDQSKKNTFDLIIGNPPYIGEKNNLALFKPIKETEFGAKYYEGKMDYFYFFVYKAWEYLKPSGFMCYLSSNYFLTADGAKKLRCFLSNEMLFKIFVNYQDAKIFPEKKLHACTYVLQKANFEETVKNHSVLYYEDQYQLIKAINRDDIYTENNTIAFITTARYSDQIKQMTQNKQFTLGDYYNVNQGIVSGFDKAFVYNQNNIENFPENLKKFLVPFYKNSDIQHFFINPSTDLRLLYYDVHTLQNEFSSSDLEDLQSIMVPYKEKLNKRREVLLNRREWFMLTWPREVSIFTGEKIVAPQRATRNKFAYVNVPFYASADVYYITRTDQSPYSLKLLTLILNSDLYYVWLSQMGKRKGKLLELYATPLKNTPLPKFEADDLIILESFAEAFFKPIQNQNPKDLLQIVETYLYKSFLITD